MLLHKEKAADVLGVILTSSDADADVVVLQSMAPDGIASRSGKLRLGDVLLAVNDVEVRGHEAASAALRAAVGELKLRISGKLDADRLCDEVIKFRIPSHRRGLTAPSVLLEDRAPSASPGPSEGAGRSCAPRSRA